MLCAINAEPKFYDFSPAENAWYAADRNPATAHAHDMDLPLHGLVDVFLDLKMVSDAFLSGMGYEFGDEPTLRAACGAAFARMGGVMVLSDGVVVSTRANETCPQTRRPS